MAALGLQEPKPTDSGAARPRRSSPAPSLPSPLAFALAVVAGVEPQEVRGAAGTSPRRAPAWALCRRGRRGPRNVHLGPHHQTLPVHQRMPFAAPETFLAGWKPSSSPPTPVLLTLWLSTMAALGSGSRPSRTPALLLRGASCDLCQVPTLSATSVSSGRRSSGCREGVRQQPPGAAAAHDLEDGVEDFADG